MSSNTIIFYLNNQSKVFFLKFKPYVPYNVKEITEPPLTAKKLFDLNYKDKLINEYKIEISKISETNEIKNK